jgi:membrane glycosyltransferase
VTQRPIHPPPRAVPDAPAEDVRSALPLETILQDWPGALARVTAYLGRIGFGPADVRRLAARAVERAIVRQRPGSAVADAIDESERLLLETQPLAGDGRGEGRLAAFARWRFAAFQAGVVHSDQPLEVGPLAPAPPLLRGPMTPALYRGRRVGERRHRRRNGERYPEHERLGRSERRGAREPWDSRGRRRRALLFLLVLVPSIVAGASFLNTLPAVVWYPVELAMAMAFGALFGWISVGFWTAVFGFYVLLRGGDRFAITKTEAVPRAPLDPAVRTAVVMPVKDESVERVFAGLRAVRASLERAGALVACDLFILSDSADPDLWADEEEAWARWTRETQAASKPEAGGIFYRHRRVRRKRKSGNVADFCRRYGRRYRYMVVLDADSVMSGECIARLIGLMEQNPHVGIVQTAPAVVRARSLFGRIQQFAARLYGPMFSAGMHYWQLGDSPYWGHNAIIRVEPFMQYCGLPRLSGRPPFGGDIMSHDFVEAALLGRARWSIWLAFDLPGTWEEGPGSLLEDLQRDRRWCQGNLQHLRLLFTEGIVRVHRGLFLNGIFSYVSAVLWLGFLVVSTVEAVLWSVWGPNYFPIERSLFPTWPVWRPERIEALLGSVFAVLLLPKLLGFLLAVIQRRAAGFGGVFVLLGSVLCETIASALFAPIRMLFYCRFVLKNMVGLSVTWRGGQDDLDETSWWTALRRHGPDTLVAFAWGFGVRVLHPEAFWWLMPVAGALVLSIPLSVFASRTRVGARARRVGLFTTPEETSPPAELNELERELTAAYAASASRPSGFVRAVADPGTNAVHTWLLRGPRRLLPKLRAERDALALRARDAGPHALTPAEKRLLLSDAPCMQSLHEAVWRLADPAAAGRWGVP